MEMIREEKALSKILAHELNIPKEELFFLAAKALLEKNLLQVNSKMLFIAGKYKIASIYEFEELYKKGLVEEKDSWEDFQEFDHLEYKRDKIKEILRSLA
jgi:hypothetical protein